MRIRLSRRLTLALVVLLGILVVPFVVGSMSPAAAAPGDLSGAGAPDGRG